MTIKITQLPTASLVKPSYYLPVVDVDDTQTEKATFTQVVAGLDGLVATLTGSNFSGPVVATGGISGSLTQLASGISYLVAGANTTITTGSNGQVTIASVGAAPAAGGSDTQIQFNNATALDGIPGFTWDGATLAMGVPVTASLGISGSQGQFGVGDAMANIGPTVTSFNMPVTASLGMSASFWIHGGLPSTQGTFRLSVGDTAFVRNILDTDDQTIFDTRTANTLNLGTDNANTNNNQFTTVAIYSKAAGQVYLGNGGTTRLRSDTNGITIYTPSDPLTFGYTGAAATGLIRMPNDSFIKSNNNAANADIPMIGTNTSDELFVGTDASYTDHAANIRAYSSAGGQVYLGYGSTTAFYVNGAGANVVSVQPLTASAISASYFNLNGSGNNLPSEGMLRVPYNQGVSDKVIVAMYSDDVTNKNFLQYGAGNTWTIGNVDQNVYTDAYAIQTVANSGAQSHYYNGYWNQYNYARAAYDLQVSTTGWNLKTKPGGQAADRMTIGHRLTLQSGSALTASFASGTTLFMTPHNSNQISLFDGTDWWQYETGQVSVSLAGLTSGSNYDIFAYDDAGTIALTASAAWSTNTTRATAVVEQDGVLVMSGDPTRRYLGTIRMSASGQTMDTNEKRLVWNYYNRVPRTLNKVTLVSATSTGTAGGTFRGYLNRPYHYSVEIVCGAEAFVEMNAIGMARHTASDFGAGTGIGIDSTTVDSSLTKQGSYTIANAYTMPNAQLSHGSAIGYHVYYMLEISSVACTFYSDNGFSAYHKMGLLGTIMG